MSGWTDPASCDPLGDLQHALELVEAARRTVMCSPENEERIRAAIDAQGLGGVFEVQSSRYLPTPDSVFLIDMRPRPFVITDVSS